MIILALWLIPHVSRMTNYYQNLHSLMMCLRVFPFIVASISLFFDFSRGAYSFRSFICMATTLYFLCFSSHQIASILKTFSAIHFCFSFYYTNVYYICTTCHIFFIMFLQKSFIKYEVVLLFDLVPITRVSRYEFHTLLILVWLETKKQDFSCSQHFSFLFIINKYLCFKLNKIKIHFRGACH